MSPSQSENTKRIAKNTLMLYGRMLIGMLVSLYTSRVVLQALGVEDYGIYNVVGGFVGMFSLISGALSHSAGRFLTFELGRGNLDALKRVFSTSLLIHIALAIIVLILAETVGLWFVNTRMTIPVDRLYAANWAFHASIVSFMMSLFCVPYSASIVSHEKMSTFAYVGILDIFARLLIVVFIANAPFKFDHLIVYAVLLVVVSFSIQSIYVIYCHRHFEECHLNLSLDKDCWKEMWAFTGWNFIGGTAVVLKDQGVNVLLNLFYGPVINTARGISSSVSNAVCSFSGNFMTALNPQITKSYAAGDYEYMFKLIERGTRFSFYIVFILGLPILFETDFVLSLWLDRYPDHTANFVRLVLVLAMIDILSNTIVTAQSATGNIRNYQIAVGGMLLMNFPLSYLLLKLGGEPECTMYVALFVSVCCLILRLVLLRKNINLSLSWFFKRICFNIISVSVVSLLFPSLICLLMNDGWIRFLFIIVSCFVCTILTVLFVGCSKHERLFIYDRIKKIKSKIASAL